MLNIGSVVGPFLAGSMASFALFGITCSQMVHYFRTYPGDHIFMKAVVVFLFIMEGAHAACLIDIVHHDYIVGKIPEKTFTLLFFTLGSAIFGIVTFTIQSTVQSFYAWRVYCLSVQHQWQKPLVLFILATSLVQTGAGLVEVYLQFGHPSVNVVRKQLPRDSILVSLVMTIVCDLTISASLVYFLNKMPVGFEKTKKTINHLTIFSISNGVLTSIIALSTLMAYYIASPTSNLYTALIMISGKTYVNSMLVTLNSRIQVRKMFVVRHRIEEISAQKN